MKLSIRLTTLAITAVAVVASAGMLGAQQRSSGHAVARAQAPRGHSENRVRQDVRPQHYAASRADVRGRSDFQVRPEVRGRNSFDARAEVRGRDDFRGRDARVVPVASHGRPLITRAAYGRTGFVGGIRYGAGFNRFGGRLVLPFGWESRIYVNGFFPVSYMSYCEPVPVEYGYMLPAMQPNYDPCLFGDRVVVMDRFSRGIVFAAVIR